MNKHFKRKNIVHPEEKEKAIQNLVNNFQNAFENTVDSKANVSTADILLATNNI